MGIAGIIEFMSIALGVDTRVAFNYTENDASPWKLAASHLQSDGTPTTEPIPILQPPAAWTRIRLEVVFSSSDGEVSLYYGEPFDAAHRIGQFHGTTAAEASLQQNTVSIAIGAGVLRGLANPLMMYFDNVVFEVFE